MDQIGIQDSRSRGVAVCGCPETEHLAQGPNATPLARLRNMSSRVWMRKVQVPLSRAGSRVSNFSFWPCAARPLGERLHRLPVGLQPGVDGPCRRNSMTMERAASQWVESHLASANGRGGQPRIGESGIGDSGWRCHVRFVGASLPVDMDFAPGAETDRDPRDRGPARPGAIAGWRACPRNLFRGRVPAARSRCVFKRAIPNFRGRRSPSGGRRQAPPRRRREMPIRFLARCRCNGRPRPAPRNQGSRPRPRHG